MGQTRDLDLLPLDSVVVMPSHASSVMLGRHVVLAWLQLARQPYDIDTALLLVTELLRHAVVDTGGPLQLSVGARGGALRVELRDEPSAARPDAEAVVDASASRRMVSALAERWGVELDLSDDTRPQRLSWFECAPTTAPRSVPRPRTSGRMRGGAADA